MKIFINILQLVGILDNDIKYLRNQNIYNIDIIENAFLVIKDDLIHDFGEMDSLNVSKYNVDEIIDCTGRLILPTYIDSHTHLVFAKARHKEFYDKINGLTYEQIAENGGGIVNSARKIAEYNEDKLYDEAIIRLMNCIKYGTGAIEIKSGYGLLKEEELKILRVINRLKQQNIIPIKSTYLALHALPFEYKNRKDDYIDYVINEILPEVLKNNLADYIDVFCEKNYFDLDDTKKLIEACNKYDIKIKAHVNQFFSLGGISYLVDKNAVSLDHLEVMTDEDIDILSRSNTVATVLPACSFFIKIPYAPAKQLVDKGAILCIASDFNPGSSPTHNLQFCQSLSSIYQGLDPIVTFNAATINAAYAIDLSHSVGSITIGKKANFFITNEINNFELINYYFGDNNVYQVYINGEKIEF